MKFNATEKKFLLLITIVFLLAAIAMFATSKSAAGAEAEVCTEVVTKRDPIPSIFRSFR